MNRSKLIALILSLLSSITFLILIHSVFAASEPSLQAPRSAGKEPSSPIEAQVVVTTANDRSQPLRELVSEGDGHSQNFSQNYPPLPLPRLGSILPGNGSAPLLSPSEYEANDMMPPPIHNFDGVSNVNSVQPPDTEGDVGYDPASGRRYYMQWVNLSLAIWDVTDPANVDQLLGPVNGNTLFSGFGGPCETTNSGDPIVLFDHLANRWLASQFALPNRPNPPYYQCIAVSSSADPTGSWNRYEIRWPGDKFNDYPKFGVWSDGYYLTVNQYVPSGSGYLWAGVGAAALERDKMLLGQPASMVYFDLADVNLEFGGLLPSDLDGPVPPNNSPNIFMSWDDSSWIGDPADTVRLWEFSVNWQTPADSTFGLNGLPSQLVETSNVDPNMCNFSRECIAQPGTANKVDAISDRLMYRLQYRNYDDYEMLLVNHTVDANGNDQAGIHWYEMRNTTGAWFLYQEGLYAPDSTNRWMGSIAADAVGNIALGYSVADSTIYPSVRYAGRYSDDPLGILALEETSLTNGTGSQTGFSHRWGDYSMMGVDPTDDCTFWYTQQYYLTSGSSWRTRIGSFKFPNCPVEPSGSLEGTVTDANTSLALEGVQIQAVASITQSGNTVSGMDGAFVLELVPGSYTVTTTASGYQSSVIPDVEIFDELTTTLNISLQAPFLEADPIALSKTLSRTNISTIPLTITNSGGVTASYEVIDSVPWLSAGPSTGSIPPSGEVALQVTFDAGVPAVGQAGVFTGSLLILNSSPYGTLDIPVSMTVLPLPITPRIYGPLFVQHK